MTLSEHKGRVAGMIREVAKAARREQLYIDINALKVAAKKTATAQVRAMEAATAWVTAAVKEGKAMNDTGPFRFQCNQIPQELRNLLEEILPPENVDKWLVDPDACGGRAPLDLLSVRHDKDAKQLEANVRQLVHAAYSTLTFVTVPSLPPVSDILVAVIREQRNVMGGDGR